MKYISLLFLLLLILQGCFWENNTAQTGLILQDRAEFSLLMPETWIEVTDIPAPKSGKVVLAYTSSSERQGYLNNIVIIETDHEVEQTSASLMKSSINALKGSIKNFHILSEKTLPFADAENGIMLVYSGKYNAATPEAIYIQTARVCGDHNYHLTLSLAEQLESYERYEYILQTFRCN